MSNIEHLNWSVADRLRKAREQAGLDQAELADRARISRGTVSAAENGRRKPSAATVSMWALTTGVSREWILGGIQQTGDAAAALEEMRLTALLAVVATANRPEIRGSAEAQLVLEAVGRRESEVQAAGEWQASSKIGHPEVLIWCKTFRPWTADELTMAMERATGSHN